MNSFVGKRFTWFFSSLRHVPTDFQVGNMQLMLRALKTTELLPIYSSRLQYTALYNTVLVIYEVELDYGEKVGPSSHGPHGDLNLNPPRHSALWAAGV